MQKREIAIIGMACRFPGANNPREFWQNLLHGKNSIREIPPDRWDWREYAGDPRKEANKSNSKWGGFIENIDQFDSLFFNISPQEANYIDPQHRLFLETVWRLMETAGYSPQGLSGRNIGVYAGVSKHDYAELLGEDISAFVSTGTVHSLLANRISYIFNFHGPSMAIDTACSSALVALHNAVRDLREGECEAAIVGGVNALLSPRMYISHAKSGMLSGDGQCKTFDEAANGYVRAEGVAALFLKPLSQALEDRDHVIGLIRSAAVNHGGRANFLTAPNVTAQTDVIYRALAKEEIDPRNISYIEAHGTGTVLGDPIEINALKKAFTRVYEERGIAPLNCYCGLGAVKTNIGHLESAAGMASIIKVLLAMERGMLPALVNFKKLNPYIELEGSPFYIVDAVTEWPRKWIDGKIFPRQAGVSAFGMGGVNAHVILEEPPAIRKQRHKGQRQGRLLLLSTKKGRLKACAGQLADFLASADGKVLHIDDIAFTLMFGREAFEERLALLAGTTAEAVDLLRGYVNGKEAEQCLHGSAPAGAGLGEPVTAKGTGDLTVHARRWVQGSAVKWDFPTFSGNRIPLPGHPFASRRCWFKTAHDGATATPAACGSAPQQLVEQITLSDQAQMIADHRVQRVKVLPGVGYLELVRQTLTRDGEGENQDWCFRNIYWLRPLAFSGQPREIKISVQAGDRERHFAISSAGEVFCQGEVQRCGLPSAEEVIDIPAVMNRCQNGETKDGLYAFFSDHGLDYGPSFQVIDRFFWSQNEALARIGHDCPGEMPTGLLDGAFQTVAGLSVKNSSVGDSQCVPYFMESFRLPMFLERVRYFYVRKQDNERQSLPRFDIYCCDDGGRIVGTGESFTKRVLQGELGKRPVVHYYTSRWQPEAGERDITAATGLVVINATKAFAKQVRGITAAGVPRTLVHLADSCAWPAADCLNINPADPVGCIRAFRDLKEKRGEFSHMVVQSGQPGSEDLRLLLLLIRSLIQAKSWHATKIVYVRENCSAADMPFVYAAAGLARTLSFEYPKISLEVVSFDQGLVKCIGELRDELLTHSAPFHEVLYRSGRRLVRAVEVLKGEEELGQLPFKRGGVYILAGGAGGLGRIFSEYLATHYQANLILLGRQKENQETASLLEKIGRLGGSGRYVAVDVGDERDLTRALEGARKRQGRIDGVIQAAGFGEDRFIIHKEPESFDKVLHPKMRGTVNLDRATSADALDFFVMFSSVASVMPNQGQCDYASANGFMDHFAEYRNRLVDDRQRSGMSLAISWPLWEQGGMQVTPEEKQHLWTVFGMKPLATDAGLTLFADILKIARGRGLSHIICLEGDGDKINKHLRIEQGQREREHFLPRLVSKDLQLIVAQSLHKTKGTFALDSTFRELGADSVALVKMTDMINRYFGADIKPTLLFEYETIGQIRDYLLQERSSLLKQAYAKLGPLVSLERSTGLLDVDKTEADRGLYQRWFSNKEFYLIDHVVEGKYNLPGACYVEMAREAGSLFQPGRKLLKIADNYWARQLSSSGVPFTAYVQLTDKEGRTDYEIFSRTGEEQKIIHAAGSLIYEQPGEPVVAASHLDLQAIRDRCRTRWTREQVYRQIRAEGLNVGPSFMPVQHVIGNEQEALAYLILPETIADTLEDYLLHPAMLTGAFQTALINNRFRDDAQDEFMPIAIESLTMREVITPKCYVYSEVNQKTKHHRDIRKFQLTICDEQGHILAWLDDFAIKARHAKKPALPAGISPDTAPCASPGLTVLKEQTQEFLKKVIAPALGIEPGEMESEEAFSAYGINSLMILGLNGTMEEAFGPGLSKTLFFEYQNIAELGDYFLEEHYGALQVRFKIPQNSSVAATVQPIDSRQDGPSPPVRAAVPLHLPRRAAAQDIAIIGLAGRYPQAETLAEFWENLKKGKDCIEEIPVDRFDYLPYYDPDREKEKLYSKWGGFIRDVDKFDPLFFNISPREAELIDPQERIFLEVAWHALEDAGYTREGLRGQSVGVFVGALWQPYQELAALARREGHAVGPSALLYSIANRLSYTCNFHGPSIAVDTACSSSLTALHLACRSIRDGESDLAIAGGVNLSIGAGKYLFLSQYKFLSSDGRCRSFGTGGDGYVPGEGVGAVLLRLLNNAEQAGDRIYGVIKATAINHGGQTNGYTVPNPLAQSEMIRQALQQAGTNARAITYVEAHGTGTALGDPIEINGLTRAFSAYGPDKQYCALGSVKSNIGHLEASAGIAGLTKILLQMKHKQLVPSLHAQEANPHIDFTGTPFVIQQTLGQWSRPTIDGKEYPLVAAISSFGAGGANAHAVIEEYREGQSQPVPENYSSAGSPALVPLSAQNEARLREYAQNLLAALKEDPTLALADIAYTLQTGREPREERVVFLATELTDLVEKLSQFAEGRERTGQCIRGRAEKNRSDMGFLVEDDDLKEALGKWLAKGKTAKLAELWVRGLTIDWGLLYRGSKPRRIGLPPYPFARERYWLPEADNESACRAAAVSVLHPLVHQNTSDFFAQRFTSTFTGREFFLADHVVMGKPVLSAAACLEMVREAVVLASGVPEEGSCGMRLKNVVWHRPMAVTEAAVQVEIVLTPGEKGEIAFGITSRSEVLGDAPLVFCQGSALLGPFGEAPVLDLLTLRSQCRKESLASEQCYRDFRAMAIDYGPGHRGIETAYIGSGQVLAKLSLPSSVLAAADQFVLHPSLLDAALQTALVFLIDEKQTLPSQPALPFALEELEILGTLPPSLWALARYTESGRGGDGMEKFDIDLCDDAGAICLRLRGFSTRSRDGAREAMYGRGVSAFPSIHSPDPLVGTLTMTPLWDPVPIRKPQSLPSGLDRLVVAGGTEDDRRAVRQLYRSAVFLTIEPEVSAEAIAEKLAACGPIDHLLWFAPSPPWAPPTAEALIEEQQGGVVQVLRMLKALLVLGYDKLELDLSLATRQTQLVLRGEPVHPAHASLHGLVGSLAREYPHWRVRLIDLEAGKDYPPADMFRLPANGQGSSWAYRRGQWHRQRLLSLALPAPDQTVYRKNGVYVVIGGAGGIGAVWSEYMIRTYGAQVVWIGRRKKDAAIRSKLEMLAAQGPEPWYIEADATDRQALGRAYGEIKARYGRIHGVIQGAIVLADKTLAQMEEEQFRAGLDAKVEVSVRLAQVFQREPLDFVLFFSSFNSFAKPPGQGNYAAGCTFQDAFAGLLAQTWPCAVKVMNWGYWGSVGVVASPAYRERMAQAGYGSLEPPEAMAALEALLAGPVDQIAFLKTTKVLGLEEMDPSSSVAVPPSGISSTMHHVQLRMAAADGSGADVRAASLTGRIEATLRQEVARFLAVPKEALDAAVGLNDYGLDRLAISKLVSTLNREYALELTPQSFSSFATIRGMAEYLAKEYGDGEGSWPAPGHPAVEMLRKRGSLQMKEMDELLCRLLWGQLRAMGLFRENETGVMEATGKIRLAAFYDRWFEESMAVLMRHRYLRSCDAGWIVADPAFKGTDAPWDEWDQRKGKWLADPDRRAYAVLLETALRALPEILMGRRPATDVLFPASSLKLVQGIYRNNAAADYFNDRLAEAVAAFVEERLRQDGAAGVRILEIGAGTGGTTAAVLERLRPYREDIAEYCYSDISQAFLLSAEDACGSRNPYLSRKIINVEEPLALQGVPVGGYDLVIAANVLHATRNIRRTLRNAKTALRKHGLLLLNELCDRSLFAHLTFGLLEGWWLCEDPEVRIPGCPGLYPRTWQEVLAEEGFSTVFFPDQEAHALGQQIIVAESNGVIRQQKETGPLPPAETLNGRTPALQAGTAQREQSRVPAGAGEGHGQKDTVTQPQQVALQLVRQALAKTVKLTPEKIDPEAGFRQYGIDSILQVQMIHELEKVVGGLPRTVLFEYGTVRDLADYLANHHADRLGERIVVQKRHRFAERPGSEERPPAGGIVPEEREDIAVIGLSGRFPLANSLEELWDHLQAGRNCLTPAPAERWRTSLARSLAGDGIFPAGRDCYGGFLKQIDRFDHYLFEIPEQEVQELSPEARLFLEIVWETFEDAGYTRRALKNFQTASQQGIGVFVGTMYSQYAWSIPSLEKAVLRSNWTDWDIANRTSHFFNLTGPSIAVNSACSSSLTAIHLACESLRQKSCSMAVAGGVNLTLDISKYNALRRIKFLGSGSQSRSFGVGDGFVPGEGVGAVMLKPLSLALRDHDRIEAVIKGSFVNHSGGRQMYGMPDPAQQTRLIVDSLRRSGIDPATIGYVEAAANGSELGDSIEVIALHKAFGQYTQERQFCALGSVKSNLGHLEAASGISQLSKVVLQLRHKTLVPSINATPRNPNIRLEQTAFYLQEETTPWQPLRDFNAGNALPRRAMINSFGAGGAYANLLVEEFPGPRPGAESVPPVAAECVLLFSAKTKRSLSTYLGEMRNFLRKNPSLSLPAVARSLRKINHNLDERMAIVTSSRQDLLEKLDDLCAAETPGAAQAGVYSSWDQISLSGPVRSPIREEGSDGLHAPARRWASGENVDIRTGTENGDAPFLPLPKYAFDHTAAFNFGEAAGLQDDEYYQEIMKKVTAGELTKEQFKKAMLM